MSATFAGGRSRGLPTSCLLLALCAACGPSAPEPEDDALSTSAPLALRVAEDLRGHGELGVQPLFEALRSSDSDRRRLAVRALGRLERSALADTIRTALFDTDAAVRAEAAFALGQAVRADPAVADVALEWVLQRLTEGERDPGVLGALGHALGRLPASDPDSVATALAALGARLLAEADQGALLEYALGVEDHFRDRPQAGLGALAEVVATLASWGRASDSPDVDAARIRRLATGLLGRADADPEVLDASLGDADGEVRRMALRELSRSRPGVLAERLPLMVGDPAPSVRIDALTLWDRELKRSQGCEPMLFGVRDADPRVALTALSLLAMPCPEAARQRTTLQGIAAELTETNWHRPSRAVWALASVAPQDAGRALEPFIEHPSAFARAWAARAAGAMENADLLERLAADTDPNVRTAALQAWAQAPTPALAEAVATALQAQDPQLVLTAAALFPAESDTVLPLLEALDRLTRMDMQTLRDPRVALVQRIGALGDEGVSGRVEPYLTDPDTVVANAAAEVWTGWGNAPPEATQGAPPVARVPDERTIARLGRSSVLLEIEGRGRIGIRLFPDLAPSNVARFVEMVERGTLDGTTFHRVVPNFVLQGGSPGANEYAGHGHYTRDEVGSMPHWRGTVGLSTRGRDTADGQIFINLVDNTRLDHTYTIIGEIALGLDVADRVLEGDRIVSATVIEGSSEETPTTDNP